MARLVLTQTVPSPYNPLLSVKLGGKRRVMGNLLQALNCNREARLAKQAQVAKEYCLSGVQASTESMNIIKDRMKMLRERNKELLVDIAKAVEHAKFHPEEADMAAYDGKALLQEKREVMEQYKKLSDTLQRVRTLNGKLNDCTDIHILRDTMMAGRKALRSMGRDAEATSEDIADDIAALLDQLSNVNKILTEPSNKDRAIVEDDAIESEWEEMVHGGRTVGAIAKRPSTLFAPNQTYEEETEEPDFVEPNNTTTTATVTTTKPIPVPAVTVTNTAVLQSQSEHSTRAVEPVRVARREEKKRLLVPA